MSTELADVQATQPISAHDWLKNLMGEWRTESVMTQGPDADPITSYGTETVTSLGGLWAFTQGSGTMPNGETMEYRSALGYDVSFNEYRGCWFASVSSHLWKYVGELSNDGKVMTLNCEGPDMIHDGKTALYRDVIEIVDANTRTMTSYAADENGDFQQFAKCTYTRV